jgi:hypothetical protein
MFEFSFLARCSKDVRSSSGMALDSSDGGGWAGDFGARVCVRCDARAPLFIRQREVRERWHALTSAQRVRRDET